MASAAAAAAARQARILEVLHAKPNQTVSSIARACKLPKDDVLVLLHAARERGLVVESTKAEQQAQNQRTARWELLSATKSKVASCHITLLVALQQLTHSSPDAAATVAEVADALQALTGEKEQEATVLGKLLAFESEGYAVQILRGSTQRWFSWAASIAAADTPMCGAAAAAAALFPAAAAAGASPSSASSSSTAVAAVAAFAQPAMQEEKARPLNRIVYVDLGTCVELVAPLAKLLRDPTSLLYHDTMQVFAVPLTTTPEPNIVQIRGEIQCVKLLVASPAPAIALTQSLCAVLETIRAEHTQITILSKSSILDAESFRPLFKHLVFNTVRTKLDLEALARPPLAGSPLRGAAAAAAHAAK
jgi:hypothetical protein